jgi:YggT family protein
VGTVQGIIMTLLEIYRYLIIGYILLSWVPNARDSFIGEFLGKLVEPYLSIFRKIIPPLGMIDFSPIVALIALYFIQIGVGSILMSLF